MEMKSIYPKPLLRRGVSLGLKASIIASLLFWGVTLIMSLFYEGEGTSNEQAGFCGVLLILVTATLVVSFFPGAIGGAANAYVLYHLASRGKLTRATSIVSGLLMGFLAGFVTIPRNISDRRRNGCECNVRCPSSLMCLDTNGRMAWLEDGQVVA